MRGCRRSQIPLRQETPLRRTRSTRPTWSSAPPPRSIVRPRRSARLRWSWRSPKSPRARANLTMRRRGRCRRAARRRWHRPWRRRRRPGPISPRSSVICSRSPARSKRCSPPAGSSHRSPPSAAELAEIRAAITEAMPRRAIESIESEIRSLSRRIDDTRQSGTDGQALAGIERALERDSRSAAFAEAGGATGRLRRGDPQSRRQARHDHARR